MASKRKSEIMWAIVGNYGLYTGTWLTRKEAIYDHTNSLGIPWANRRKVGDRAVRVRVTITEDK